MTDLSRVEKIDGIWHKFNVEFSSKDMDKEMTRILEYLGCKYGEKFIIADRL